MVDGTLWAAGGATGGPGGKRRAAVPSVAETAAPSAGVAAQFLGPWGPFTDLAGCGLAPQAGKGSGGGAAGTVPGLRSPHVGGLPGRWLSLFCSRS